MEYASSSFSSSSKPQWMYDVFMNFRGEDTRKNFVSHLYAALSNAGVKTFLDEESFPKGVGLKEELFRSIDVSRICVVVFSKNYPSSSWCLQELEKIIQCHKTYGHRVVPIFYGVDPSDVRHQKGAFGNSLQAFVEKTYWEQDVESAFSRWGSILTKAANFSGWDVSKYWNEATVVKKIVKDILKMLDNTLLSITEFPVGLESHVQEVIGFIPKKSKNVCIIGIWGMGGLGKTTTAKAIYNEIHHRFMDKSFIENIREVCETSSRGHVDLQEQLLSDILKKKVNIYSVGMGRKLMQNNLSRRKALIVLDDVNEFDQLKDLCGNRTWFGQESIIIITTRDVRLLNTHKVDYIYKMKEMNKIDSLKLFSWHAFRQEKPQKGFNELSRNVIVYSGGLPLALEVLGSYLSERTEKEWKSVLSKLEIIPNDKVHQKLRISFDGLSDQMEKDIFLDMCCFFIGKDRAYVTEILNGCGLHADIGITVLIERSLIKVEKNNKLGMHQLLRDMGREIIRESSIKEPGKRSRLWFQQEVIDVLTKNIGTETIEGLTLELNFTSRDCFETYTFEKMRRLRLLQLDHVQLNGNFEYLSKQLRWICWQGFPSKYIPNNFNMEKVIAIDLKLSSLILVWKESQVLQWLKFLNLSHSNYLKQTPDFSKLPSLEKLILKDCPSLCKLHKSIGVLHNLLLINLKDCTNLSNLPREIYQLKSLKTLILSGCLKIDKLEEDIGQMESLTTLMADNTSVKQVPFSIVSSKNIGYISMCGYEGLSRNVFPSIIWSWMSPTMNPLSYIHSFCGTSSSLVSMGLKNNNLGDIASMLSILSNLRSVLVQCDTELQLSKQVRTILNDVYGANCTESEVMSNTPQVSKYYLRSYLIGIGNYQEVFNTLNDSISKGLANSESCDVSLPGDNGPFWLAHIGEGHSVYFTVPEDCRMKGMTLCIVYLSNLENIAAECLMSVLMVNYTKCTIQIYKKQTVISFNDEDWQSIISHLGAGDKVEIFVTFGHGLVVKKISVYLIYGESNVMEIDPLLKPMKETNKKACVKFIDKESFCVKTSSPIAQQPILVEPSPVEEFLPGPMPTPIDHVSFHSVTEETLAQYSKLPSKSHFTAPSDGSPIDDHLRHVEGYLKEEIPMDSQVLKSLRSSLSKLSKAANVSETSRRIFNRINLDLGDVVFDYHMHKARYDSAAHNLKQIRDLLDQKSSYTANFQNVDSELQKDLEELSRLNHNVTELMVDKELTEVTTKIALVNQNVKISRSINHGIQQYILASSLDNEINHLLQQSVSLEKDFNAGELGIMAKRKDWYELRNLFAKARKGL